MALTSIRRLPAAVAVLLLFSGTACSEQAAQTSSQAAQTPAQQNREDVQPAGQAAFERACATCHEGAVPKAPHKDMIALMTPEAILNALTDGIMQNEAAVLNEIEKIAVAEYLAGQPMGAAVLDIPLCQGTQHFDPLAPALASNWGLADSNHRFIPASLAGLTRTDFDSLSPFCLLYTSPSPRDHG